MATPLFPTLLTCTKYALLSLCISSGPLMSKCSWVWPQADRCPWLPSRASWMGSLRSCCLATCPNRCPSAERPCQSFHLQPPAAGKGNVALHGFHPHDQGYWLVLFGSSQSSSGCPWACLLAMVGVELMSLLLFPRRVI